MFYSKLTGGFYDQIIHNSMPSDAVAITDDEHKSLIDGQSNGKQIVADENGHPVLIDPPIPSVNERRKLAKNKIDATAGLARLRFVSTGYLIDQEYQQAEHATQVWRQAGSPDNDIPADIISWADAAGITAEAAAADIENTSISWRAVLTVVRQIRLAGKAAVDAAADQNTADDMMTVAQPYIDQLDALMP